MDQAYIIDEITDVFAEKLKEISSEDIPFDVVTSDIEENEGDRHIRIYILGVEPVAMHNMSEKFRRKGVDENGEEYEYLTKPPQMLQIWYMVVPLSQSMKESYRMLGLVIRHVMDNGFLTVNECDWLGNEGDVIRIERTEDMNIDKQMQIFQQLNQEFRPALFYNVIVGINSGEIERIKLVQHIDLNTYNTQDRGKKKLNENADDSDEKKTVTVSEETP